MDTEISNTETFNLDQEFLQVKIPFLEFFEDDHFFLFLDDSRGRTCGPLEAGYCSNLPYNITTYPNMLGHSDIHQVDMVIDIVKEIVDTGRVGNGF